MNPIDVKALSKSYGDVVGIDSLTFSVKPGEVFGFLGPNGAGKTTAIRTLLGLQSPTSGKAHVLGASITDESELLEAKTRIGYLPSDLAFNESVSGKRVLDYHASIKGDSRRAELLEIFTPPIDRPIREYSTGNEQMLGIVQAFMHDPDLVIMDEPTSGLDPLKQERFNQFITNERDRGTTIFFSSHVLSEVRRVCDRVGILRDGALVGLETIESLLNQGGKRVQIQTPDTIESQIEALDGVFSVISFGETVQFTYTGTYNNLISELQQYDIVDINISEPPLEDIFMHYYGSETEPDTETEAAHV
ncbi:ABC transporter ATP-binding protein [Natronocalculus amylovorans]|uniref:ABC transporter ATP-binding protein n=1 Tax=Natronocalculus amylovorans TaxID=2917812 RepID=A0AAE3G1A8_9EURY|nr:ABC transporter ATP-binding protein [Natronocalculus amylovorans]MCL9818119.1 ABC transporter ATP-binding protein [Natronocalculus amylovorans]